MSTGGFSFQYYEKHELRNSINEKNRSPIAVKFPPQFKKLVSKMIDKDHAKRIDLKEILRFELFNLPCSQASTSHLSPLIQSKRNLNRSKNDIFNFIFSDPSST
jgi:serine/threonine protein kinase